MRAAQIVQKIAALPYTRDLADSRFYTEVVIQAADFKSEGNVQGWFPIVGRIVVDEAGNVGIVRRQIDSYIQVQGVVKGATVKGYRGYNVKDVEVIGEAYLPADLEPYPDPPLPDLTGLKERA